MQYVGGTLTPVSSLFVYGINMVASPSALLVNATALRPYVSKQEEKDAQEFHEMTSSDPKR